MTVGLTPNLPGYKVVLLGDASVGKSSIVMRFVNNRFSQNAEATVGAAFSTQSIEVDEETVKFEIWDTAGQERFRSLAPMYYRGSACAIVVFDVSNAQTFEKAKDWVEELKNNVDNSEYLVIALAANKIDLRSEVDAQKVLEYARDEGLLYAETSAKSGAGVKSMFEELARTVPDMVRREEEAAAQRKDTTRILNLLDGDNAQNREEKATQSGCMGCG